MHALTENLRGTRPAHVFAGWRLPAICDARVHRLECCRRTSVDRSSTHDAIMECIHGRDAASFLAVRLVPALLAQAVRQEGPRRLRAFFFRSAVLAAFVEGVFSRLVASLFARRLIAAVRPEALGEGLASPKGAFFFAPPGLAASPEDLLRMVFAAILARRLEPAFIVKARRQQLPCFMGAIIGIASFGHASFKELLGPTLAPILTVRRLRLAMIRHAFLEERMGAGPALHLVVDLLHAGAESFTRTYFTFLFAGRRRRYVAVVADALLERLAGRRRALLFRPACVHALLEDRPGEAMALLLARGRVRRAAAVGRDAILERFSTGRGALFFAAALLQAGMENFRTVSLTLLDAIRLAGAFIADTRLEERVRTCGAFFLVGAGLVHALFEDVLRTLAAMFLACTVAVAIVCGDDVGGRDRDPRGSHRGQAGLLRP